MYIVPYWDKFYRLKPNIHKVYKSGMLLPILKVKVSYKLYTTSRMTWLDLTDLCWFIGCSSFRCIESWGWTHSGADGRVIIIIIVIIWWWRCVQIWLSNASKHVSAVEPPHIHLGTEPGHRLGWTCSMLGLGPHTCRPLLLGFLQSRLEQGQGGD